MHLAKPGPWSALIFVGACALVGLLYWKGAPDAAKMAASLVGLIATWSAVGPARHGKRPAPLPPLIKPPVPKIPPMPVLMVGMFMCAAISCKPTPGPDGGVPVLVEAGTQVVNSGCTLLEGITQNQTILSICATIEEIATIASFVVSFLRHGETVDAGACVVLGSAGVCATKQELGPAIQLLIAKRRALLLLDAGAEAGAMK